MNLTEELNEYFPVWQKLNPAQQHLLEHSVQKRRFMKGENVHGSGKSCLGFLIIKTGQMRAYILSEAGREVTLYHVYEREMCLFSASCKMQNIQFDIYVDAEKDTEVLQIPTTIFYSLMNESLPMARFTNDLMATHLTDVMWLIEQILFKRVDQRLAKFLLEEIRNEGSEALSITHETIAQNLGTAREVVTRMLKYFQTEKWVSLTRGQIRVTDPQQLQRLV